MKKEQLQLPDGFLVVDLIYTKPASEGLNLINPTTQREFASYDKYHDHPFRALVVKSCESFFNNGIQYPCPVHEGDVVLVPGWPLKPDLCIIEGVTYIIIRYTDIRGHFTPDEEQMKNITLARQSDPGANQKELSTPTIVRGEA